LTSPTVEPVTRTTLAIANPAARSGKLGKRWPDVERILREFIPDCTVALTSCQGDATRIACEFVRGGGRDIVVFGGDGTINEVVGGLFDDRGVLISSDVTLGVVHQGTGGDFARGLGIPRDERSAIEIAANGDTREIDLGVATSVGPDGERIARGFGVVATVGLGSDVVRRATGILKKFGNSASFAVASIFSLAEAPERRFRIRFDGGDWFELDVVDLMIANNRFAGGGMMIAPMAEVDDGQFDVMMIAATARLKLIGKFPKIYRGTHVHEPMIRFVRAASVEIEAANDREYHVALDGELSGSVPLRAQIVPRAVRVRVPRGAGATIHQ
jgi:YegS/Rv2252/BmrU family lipid kinase